MTYTQELYCTNCSATIRFITKPNVNGNKIIVCDECGHQHCRVVVDGIVTGDRWDSRSESVDTIHGVKHRTTLWQEQQAKKRKKK